jgi:putative intracellular protease/amidase
MSPVRARERSISYGTVLQSKAVAFLAAAEGTEQSELTRPWERVAAEAGQPVLVSPRSGEIQMFEHPDRDGQMAVDVPVDRAREADFDALVLPGGVANPASPPPPPRERRTARRAGAGDAPGAERRLMAQLWYRWQHV